MNTNSSGENVKDALQRLLDGLQRTLQVFKVFSKDDIEREDHTHRLLKSKDIFRKTHFPLWFDKTKYTLEKELKNYEYEPISSKILHTEHSTTRNVDNKIAGPSGYYPNHEKQRPGDMVPRGKQELYTILVNEPQNSTKYTESYSKDPKKTEQFSKGQTCRIEEIELSDKILVRCTNPTNEATKSYTPNRINSENRRGEKEEEDQTEANGNTKARGGVSGGCCMAGSSSTTCCFGRKRSGEGNNFYKSDDNLEEDEDSANSNGSNTDKEKSRGWANFDARKRNTRGSKDSDADETNSVSNVHVSEEIRNGDAIVQPDFVLVFAMKNDVEFGDFLRHFEENLKDERILVETIIKKDFQGSFAKLKYIKVQIPMETVLRLANTYDVKLACNNPYYEQESPARYSFLNTKLTNRVSAKGVQPKEPTSAERIMVLYEILKITQFSDAPEDAGVQELKSQRIINAAYPVHDGTAAGTKNERSNDRQLLKEYWGNMSSMMKIQPIQHIHKYFGPETAFYFALMGFYISLLIPLALAGTIPIINGLLTYGNSTPVKDFCTNKSLLVCPICKFRKCNFTSVNGSCSNSKVMWVMDNSYTMLFAGVMSVWGIAFILLWRTYENSLKIVWNLHRCFKADLTPRPRFYKKPQRWQPLPSSKKDEPTLSMQRQLLAWLSTVAIILAVFFLVLLIVLVIIMCRIEIVNFLINQDCGPINKELKLPVCNSGRAHLLAAWMTALLTSVVIIILDPLFDRLAIFLANVHNPRTQVEVDQLCIIFMFTLSCINNYPTVIYMAFFRSYTFTYPGDEKMWDFFFGINRDQCDFAGCTLELAILLTMIFTAKIIMNVFKKRLCPSWHAKGNQISTNRPQWELDSKLKPIPEHYFTKLNIELLIQYGFVVSFLPAFTLLPLLALIYSAIELRLNAQEVVWFCQRPVPRQTVRDRNTWNKILYIQTFAGVIVHAYTSAFTVEFIMQQLHKSYFHQYDLKDYFNVWQSSFKTRDYKNFTTSPDNVFCRYKYSLRTAKATNYSLKGEHYVLNSNRLNIVTIAPGLIFILAAILLNTLPEVPNNLTQKVQYQEKSDVFGK